MPPMDDDRPAQDIESKVLSLIARLAGRKAVTLETSVNRDLGIEGDDASDLIDWLHKQFGTSFVGLDMRDYFNDEGTESIRWFRSRKRPLTVGHIVSVVKKGAWFDA